IVRAKTLQYSFEHEDNVPQIGIMSLKGKVTVAQGGKALLEGKHGGDLAEVSVKFVSDGSNVQSTLLLDGQDRREAADTPKSFHESLTKSFSRCGCYVIRRLMDHEFQPGEDPKLDVEKLLVVSDFKLGPREKVGKVDTQAIHYRLDFIGHDRFAATV